MENKISANTIASRLLKMLKVDIEPTEVKLIKNQLKKVKSY